MMSCRWELAKCRQGCRKCRQVHGYLIMASLSQNNLWTSGFVVSILFEKCGIIIYTIHTGIVHAVSIVKGQWGLFKACHSSSSRRDLRHRIIEAEKLKLAEGSSSGAPNLGAFLLDFFKFFGDECLGLLLIWREKPELESCACVTFPAFCAYPLGAQNMF